MRRFALLALIVCVAGCASLKSNGRLVSLADGSTIVLQMEFSGSGGTMIGTHPVTGERFSGDYAATMSGTKGVVGSIGVAVRNTAGQGAGVLRGDRGTILHCEINVSAGNKLLRRPPTGHGTCVDQQGQRYHLQF